MRASEKDLLMMKCLERSLRATSDMVKRKDIRGEQIIISKRVSNRKVSKEVQSWNKILNEIN